MTKTRKTKSDMSSLKLDIPHSDLLKPKITIFGAGGAGGNAINNMIRADLEGVEFVAANTDAQALQNSLAQYKIQLGIKTTKGLGAGSFPDRGRAAAEENIEEIEKLLEGNNMIFIAAGMGGGTGTGAAPVIAKLAREREILTVGVVTKPFHFEGKYRMETAESGIEELKKYVDTLIVIPNQNLFRIANEHTTFESAFKMADDVLHAGVRGITDLITMPGLVNLDFADIRTIMTKMGKAMMGTGEATGENRAIAACEAAISNPLLDDISIKGAKGVLVNMTGGPDMTLFEADLAVNTIKREVDPSANIIFGSAFNENMKGKIRISVVATGIEEEEFRRDIAKKDFAETGRFMVNIPTSKDKKEATRGGDRNFFDPGLSSAADDSIEEITDYNFKPKKSFQKEENEDYGNIEDEKKSTNADFFVETESDKNEILIDEEEVEISRVTTIKKQSKKSEANTSSSTRVKKDSGGFSLFSFMNSSKSKSVVDLDDDIDEEVEEISREPEGVTEEKPVSKKPTLRKSKTPSNEKSDHEEEESSKKKTSHEIEKKRREFFSSTIFDNEPNDIGNEVVEDDILNVPAFFRRKKK